MEEAHPEKEITRLLLAWSDGDRDVEQALLPLVYSQLQDIAKRYLRRERSDHTLETSGLVNEAYLKLVDQNRVQWRGRAHFFAISSQIMRRILVDHAREKAAEKRGGLVHRISLEDTGSVALERAPDLLDLDDALNALAEQDPEAARLVELRYFGGLTKEELAEVLKISTATVARRWRMIRAWLHTYLVKGERHGV